MPVFTKLTCHLSVCDEGIKVVGNEYEVPLSAQSELAPDERDVAAGLPSEL